ncbi:hypothetical protein PINS_up011031 [Pythium insidiosum]|nr:hypothetical protein PINS_up011031 [Pythium insidiosum]
MTERVLPSLASSPASTVHGRLKIYDVEPIVLPPRASNRPTTQSSTSSRGHAAIFSNGVGAKRPATTPAPSTVVAAAATGAGAVSPSSTKSVPLPPPPRMEPVEFDPFVDSPCCALLARDPSESLRERQDSEQLVTFREWLATQFPRFIETLQRLQMLHRCAPGSTNPAEDDDEDAADYNARIDRRQEDDDAVEKTTLLQDADDDDTRAERSTQNGSENQENDSAMDIEQLMIRAQRRKRRRDAQDSAWRLLFENARLLAVPPGQHVLVQDVTPTRDVLIVLSGRCEEVFRPRFLEFLLARRRAETSNRVSPSPPPSSTSPQGRRRRAGSTSPLLPAPSPVSAATQQVIAQLSDLSQAAAPMTASRPATLTRRLSLSTIGSADADPDVHAAVSDALSAVVPLRVLSSGDVLGVEAAAFSFGVQPASAVSLGALQRNAIGVTTRASLHVLSVPFLVVSRIRELVFASSIAAVPRGLATPSAGAAAAAAPRPPRRLAHTARAVYKATRTAARGTGGAASSSTSASSTLPPPLPGCGFRDEDVEFLRHTFVFQSCQLRRLEFLATQMRLVQIPKHEYLFTTGQSTAVYLVKSGQLRVFSPEDVRLHVNSDSSSVALSPSSTSSTQQHQQQQQQLLVTETRHVELEILQLHDLVGVMEACLLQPTFSTYCIAASSDVSVYVFSPFALLAVLHHEPTASQHIVESLVRHHSWFKARKFTALNRHNTQTEFRLSLSAQRKSPIQCSRCGWSGHSSTSSICVRATSPKLAFIHHLTRGGSDAAIEGASGRQSRVGRTRSQQFTRAGSMVRAAGADASVATIESASVVAAAAGLAGQRRGAVWTVGYARPVDRQGQQPALVASPGLADADERCRCYDRGGERRGGSDACTTARAESSSWYRGSAPPSLVHGRQQWRWVARTRAPRGQRVNAATDCIAASAASSRHGARRDTDRDVFRPLVATTADRTESPATTRRRTRSAPPAPPKEGAQRNEHHERQRTRRWRRRRPADGPHSASSRSVRLPRGSGSRRRAHQHRVRHSRRCEISPRHTSQTARRLRM